MSEREREDYPAAGTTEARELFVSHYRAKFGPHPAERNVGEFRLWAAVIDRIEPRLYERVVAMMSLGRDTRDRGKPRLDDLWAAHGRLTARFVEAAPRVTADCAFCGGCGWFSVPARQRRDGRWTFESREGDLTPLTMTAWPCKCSAGSEKQRGRVDSAALAEAWEVHRQALRACGQTDADVRDVSLGEFLAQHQGDKVLGTARLYADAIRDSYRAVYGDAAAPEPEAELKPSRTLAYLRERAVRKEAEAAKAAEPGLTAIAAGDVVAGMAAPRPEPEDDYEREERLAIQSEGSNAAPW